MEPQLTYMCPLFPHFLHLSLLEFLHSLAMWPIWLHWKQVRVLHELWLWFPRQNMHFIGSCQKTQCLMEWPGFPQRQHLEYLIPSSFLYPSKYLTDFLSTFSSSSSSACIKSAFPPFFPPSSLTPLTRCQRYKSLTQRTFAWPSTRQEQSSCKFYRFPMPITQHSTTSKQSILLPSLRDQPLSETVSENYLTISRDLLYPLHLPCPLLSIPQQLTVLSRQRLHNTLNIIQKLSHILQNLYKNVNLYHFGQQKKMAHKMIQSQFGLYQFKFKINSHQMNESQCPKCGAGWTQENPPKKLINCHHNLCLRCLKDQLICPIDKSRIEKRKYTLEAFLTNNELLESVALSKMAKPREKSKGHSRSQSSSNTNNAKCAKEFTTPIMDKYPTIEDKRSMLREKQTVVEVQLPCLSPEKGNQTSSKLTISPKRVRLSFDTCLLHSKKADLICLEDKCLICANCGLFGEHKQHKIIPYDEFLNQYSKITEESFKIYEQLKQKQDKLDAAILEAKIDEILKEKRDAEVKHIKTNTAAYIDFIKRLERQLILDLDVAFSYKRKKMQKYDQVQEMIKKRDQFIASIETMSNGVDDIFNLENIGQYINYIDKQSPHSFIINQGEYLLLEIDNYYKQKIQTIQDETNDITYEFSLNLDSLKDSVNLISKDFKEISSLIEQSKKKTVPKTNPYINKHQTPNRTPVTGSVNNSQSIKNLQKSPTVKAINEEEQLLIGTNSKSNSKGSSQKKKKEVSPIQPACTFDDDHPLIKPYEGDTKDIDSFLKFSQVECNISPALIPRHPSLANQASRTKKILENRENNLSNSRASRSRSKYGTAERQSYTNVLGEKSQNKKKRKLDLPDKYLRVYQDLQKDKLQVLDLGGAFLGEPNILIISELFTSRCKLRSVKLMNNKLTDESFPEIVSRCRFISSINLSYNLITEKSLEWLQQCCDNLGELKNITLSNNKIVLRNVRERLDGLARRGIKVSL